MNRKIKVGQTVRILSARDISGSQRYIDVKVVEVGKRFFWVRHPHLTTERVMVSLKTLSCSGKYGIFFEYVIL